MTKTKRIDARASKNRSKERKIYFISDAHLGLASREEEIGKELRLVRFLDRILHDADRLYIVGDLFDYWFEYKTVVPKGYYRLFSKLAELTDSGVRLIFIAGNHDFWVKRYFTDELGMEVLREPIEENIRGKKFYIHHGDGLSKNDLGYRILKKILRNRMNIFIFSLIHPDITGWLARWSSRTSRQYTSGRKYEEADMVRYAAEKCDKGADFVVMGHSHRPAIQKTGNGFYVNLGDWIHHNTYAVFDGKKIELKKWIG
jgi:UDP-2,3-diacylglucosamine hydrolase